MSNNQIIEDLIKKALTKLQAVYPGDSQKDKPCQTKDLDISPLSFPKIYNDKKKKGLPRVSEQEIRFLLTEELSNKRHVYPFHYSVETPTQLAYKFSDKGKKLSPPEVTKDGQSANVDVCLYADSSLENLKVNKKYYIEFKGANVLKEEITKDFLKLLHDGNGPENYFVHIIESCDSGTRSNIEDKYKWAINIVDYPFFSQLTIYLYFIKANELYKYTVNKKGGKGPILCLDKNAPFSL